MTLLFMRLRLIIVLLLPFTHLSVHGQQVAFGIKFTGLAIHPRPQPSAGQYAGKFDRKGYVVLNRGITLSADIGIYKQVGLKLAQALVWRDCAGKFAMLSHIGVNFGGAGATLGHSRLGISGSIGPVLYRRRSWQDLPGYIPDNSWLTSTPSSHWETKLILFGGQLEYTYYWHQHYGLSLNVLPGYPDVISVVAGPTIRQRVATDSK